jgi:prephenate dehydrogenase
MLIMDVGSTKRDVVDAARRVLREQMSAQLRAGPPDCRQGGLGVEHADPDLYTGKQVILTPIERTHTASCSRPRTSGPAMGCKVLQMSPESHDAAFAAVSHLPHLMAFALMNAITGPAAGQGLPVAGRPGFRDFTRIAASDPKIWRDILLANREELLHSPDLPAHAAGAGADDFQRQRRRAGRPGDRASNTRAHWRMGEQPQKVTPAGPGGRP